MAKNKENKKPKSNPPPRFTKNPRHEPTRESIIDKKLEFSFQCVDLGGPWCFGKKTDAAAVKMLFDKFRSFETMTWAQVESAGSHFIAVNDITTEAQNRLGEIFQDDTDSVFSLHLTGRARVFGLRFSSVLRLLWWDPNHEVCPSYKKHT